jgi:hypothetical protein
LNAGRNIVVGVAALFFVFNVGLAGVAMNIGAVSDKVSSATVGADLIAVRSVFILGIHDCTVCIVDADAFGVDADVVGAGAVCSDEGGCGGAVGWLQGLENVDSSAGISDGTFFVRIEIEVGSFVGVDVDVVADAVGVDAVGPETVGVVSGVGFAWIDVFDVGTANVGADAVVDAGIVWKAGIDVVDVGIDVADTIVIDVVLLLLGMKIGALGDNWC